MINVRTDFFEFADSFTWSMLPWRKLKRADKTSDMGVLNIFIGDKW